MSGLVSVQPLIPWYCYKKNCLDVFFFACLFVCLFIIIITIIIIIIISIMTYPLSSSIIQASD